jgi:hypothetical protein
MEINTQIDKMCIIIKNNGVEKSVRHGLFPLWVPDWVAITAQRMETADSRNTEKRVWVKNV